MPSTRTRRGPPSRPSSSSCSRATASSRTSRTATCSTRSRCCDYIFPKDKIFAYLNLDDSELLIYDKLYAMLEPQTPKPDLVIYLQAETARLVERIKRPQP